MAHRSSMHVKFKFFFVTVITFSVFIGNIPLVFATVLDDYISYAHVTIEGYARDVNGRSEWMRIFDQLSACLAQQQSGRTTPNWQVTSSGPINSRERLSQELQSNYGHPCAEQYTAFDTFRSSHNSEPFLYPPIIAQMRSISLNNAIQQGFGSDTALHTKIDNYSNCLVAETGGVPNWQSGGTNPPATYQELSSRVNGHSEHPCFQQRELVIHHCTSDPADRSSGPNCASPSSASGSTATASGSTASGATVAPTSAPTSSGLSIDNRPIYQRIVEPNSQDVLTPSFATGSTPSISGFINYLFDLLVRRILPLMVGVMVVFIIWGGYQYIMAAGDPAKIKQARDTILYSVIAMILALSALTIVTVLNNILLQTTP